MAEVSGLKNVEWYSKRRGALTHIELVELIELASLMEKVISTEQAAIDARWDQKYLGDSEAMAEAIRYELHEHNRAMHEYRQKTM